MPLMTIKEAAAELGYRSNNSILALADRGVLKIVSIPGKKRPTRRIDRADVERIKQGGAVAVNQTPTRRPLRHQAPVKLPTPPRAIRHYA